MLFGRSIELFPWKPPLPGVTASKPFKVTATSFGVYHKSPSWPYLTMHGGGRSLANAMFLNMHSETALPGHLDT